MIPLVVINSVNLSKAQASLEKQEAGNTDYPGINYFQEGSVEVSFYFDQQFWLERLMMALMSSNIPFQVEYWNTFRTVLLGSKVNEFSSRILV